MDYTELTYLSSPRPSSVKQCIFLPVSPSTVAPALITLLAKATGFVPRIQRWRTVLWTTRAILVHIDQCITGNMATTDVGALKIDLTSAVIFVVNKDLYIYITIHHHYSSWSLYTYHELIELPNKEYIWTADNCAVGVGRLL